MISKGLRTSGFLLAMGICAGMFTLGYCKAQPVSQQKIATYTLDEIPTVSFWRGSAITWQLQQPGAQAPYSVTADTQVHGTLTIDKESGVFRFVADSKDLGNYHLTVNAKSGDGSVLNKQFTISVLTGMLPEAELVSKARPLPQDDSSEYIVVSETCDPVHRSFNTLADQKLVDVVISGKRDHFRREGRRERPR